MYVKDYQHIVDIEGKTCDCRRWELTGIPGSHAISCLMHERIPPESIVANCYSVEAFMTAYASNIWPCRDITEWQKMDGPEVNPPVHEKKVGRPPKARKKQPQEIQGKYGPKLSKHGVLMHCSWCNSTEHNVRKCTLKKAGIKPVSRPEQDAVPTENATGQPEQDVVPTE